jgi:hypothetical protein
MRVKGHGFYSCSSALERRFASHVVGTQRGMGTAWQRARPGTTETGLVGQRWTAQRGLRACGAWHRPVGLQASCTRAPRRGCMPRRPAPVRVAARRRVMPARAARSGCPGYKTFCPGIL